MREGTIIVIQNYIIAGLKVQMDSFGRTVSQAEPYLADFEGSPDISITQSRAEALLQKQPHLTLDICEYLCTGGQFYRELLKYGGFMLHSSAVVINGYAYLFSAPCQTGKTTHTSLWCKVFGDAAVILNDDKPALRKENGVWYAYGTPWSGESTQNLNMRVQVGGICILRRGEVNEIEKCQGSQAVFPLLEQVARPSNAINRGKLLELLDDLIENVPIWLLKCNMEEEAAVLSHTVMSGEAEKRFGIKRVQ